MSWNSKQTWRLQRCLAGRILGAVFLAQVLFLWGCEWGHMKKDEAVHTYERTLPDMPKRSIPVDGGIQILREANPLELRNPVPDGVQMVDRGRERYSFYCQQCHGVKADGNGTVGQSFAPLPTNLKGRTVQEQTDGELFYKISLGFNRHPPLYYTITEENRWAIIRYLRSIADRPAA